MDLLTSFEGHIPRTGFWTGLLAIAAVAAVLGLGMKAALPAGIALLPGQAVVAVGIAFTWPAALVKRLHDRGKPALPWLAIFLVPGDNACGPDPLDGSVEAQTTCGRNPGGIAMLRTALVQLNGTQAYLFRTTPDGRRLVSWRVWVLTFLLPALFLFVAAVIALETMTFLSKAQRTTGEVVRVYSRDAWNPWDGDTTDYSPVFRYRFSEDEVTEASNGQSSPNWNFEIGSKHDILFLPDRKQDVRLDLFERLWALPVTIGLIGLVLLVPSLIGACFVLRWRNGGTATVTSDG